MKIMGFLSNLELYAWETTSRYSVKEKSFRLTTPLFNNFSKSDNYRFIVSVDPVGNELVIDAIKNMDIQYKNGESRTSGPSKHASNGRTELS
jgi:hypothetical protein